MMPLQQAAAKFALNAINKFIKVEHPATVEIVDLHIAAGKLSDALADEQAHPANSRIASLYEELRKATDGGSESMTHDDALKQIEYWQGKCNQVQVAVPQQGGACNPHPDAPHGFSRNASHSAGRYVCDCEGWVQDCGEAQGAQQVAVPVPLSDEQIQKIWDVASGSTPGWCRHITYARALFSAAQGAKK